MLDFILDGQGHGALAQRLLRNNFDVRALRPFEGKDGRTYVMTLNSEGKLVPALTQNTATLRKDEWILLDQAVIKAAKPRLSAVGDLRGTGLTFTVPQGMGKTVLEYQKQSDINEATISMDATRKSENDRPEYDLAGLPLPIIHKDWQISLRFLQVSRNGGSPIDTTMAELAARRVAEYAENMLLGAAAYTYAFAGYSAYGYRTFPSRNTKTITSPEAMGWTPAVLVQEVLEAILQLKNDYYFGPYMMYTSLAWDTFLDDDYSAAYPNVTLRDRVRKIASIQDVRTLDYLSNYDIILVQMTPDVVREVIGMEMTNVMWETEGGMLLNFKTMAIMVPQLRSDINGNCGLLHAAPA